jgi:hypothetical protein
MKGPAEEEVWRVDEYSDGLRIEPIGFFLQCYCELPAEEPAHARHRAMVRRVAALPELEACLRDLLASYLAECHRTHNLAKRPGRFYGEDQMLVKRARALLARKEVPDA